MKAASIHEIKQELKTLNATELLEVCLRLARAKKENKELLTYLLFEAHDIDGYISHLKSETAEAFTHVHTHNLYFLKKNLRKILSWLNKHLRFAGSKAAEAEVLLYFCVCLHQHKIPYKNSMALHNLYNAQLKKIKAAIGTLHEDLQHDFTRQLNELHVN